MSIETITNHADQAKNRLPNRFSLAMQFQNLINLIGERTQELEAILFNLFEQRAISTATGKQLDKAGEILNVARNLGELDDEYRSRLYSSTGQLEKSGEVESVIDVFDFLYTPTLLIYNELYPAAFSITGHLFTDPELSEIDQYNYKAINAVKSGGIDFDIILSPDTEYFYLSDVSEVDVNGDGPIDSLHGLGDESLTEGGMLSRSLFLYFNIYELLTESGNELLTEYGDVLIGIYYGN